MFSLDSTITISEVVKHQARTSDREVESTINQIITGQVALNHSILRPKLTIRNQTNVIFATKKLTIQHYIFSNRCTGKRNRRI